MRLNLKYRHIESLKVSLFIGTLTNVAYSIITLLLPKYIYENKNRINEEELWIILFNYKTIIFFIITLYIATVCYTYIGEKLNTRKNRLLLLFIFFVLSLLLVGIIGFAYHYIGVILYVTFSCMLFSIYYLICEYSIFKKIIN